MYVYIYIFINNLFRRGNAEFGGVQNYFIFYFFFFLPALIG